MRPTASGGQWYTGVVARRGLGENRMFYPVWATVFGPCACGRTPALLSGARPSSPRSVEASTQQEAARGGYAKCSMYGRGRDLLCTGLSPPPPPGPLRFMVAAWDLSADRAVDEREGHIVISLRAVTVPQRHPKRLQVFIVMVGFHVLQSMRTLAPLHSRVKIADLPGTVSTHCCCTSTGTP